MVRGLTGQTIVHTAAESGSGGEVLLAELTNCTVFILGTLDALWMYALQGCRVYGGPVRGATFVDGRWGAWECGVEYRGLTYACLYHA